MAQMVLARREAKHGPDTLMTYGIICPKAIKAPHIVLWTRMSSLKRRFGWEGHWVPETNFNT